MQKRVETKAELQTYLDRLKYALDNGANINIQVDRWVDANRSPEYTNRYTIADLFPGEDPVVAVKRELRSLTVENYVETVKDTNFPERSDWRVFGKTYFNTKEVYIKLRVEVQVRNFVFVMSFHYTTIPFADLVFPFV